MSAPKTIRWGILATGGIAESFTKDLLVDPATRDVHHLKHTVVAAASSSSESRAADFLKSVGAPSTAKAYGSYASFVTDPDIDIVYIATPHSHHYQNAMLCLTAGKNVLCEKAFTANAAQLRRLIAVARERDLFLMEAVWTRYFPLSMYMRDLVTSGTLGTVVRVSADLSIAADPESSFADASHRLVNPALAGGALLDLGIYSLTWLFQTLYHTLPPAARAPPTVHAAVTRYAATGVDESTSALLTFARAPGGAADAPALAAHGIATTSLRVASDPDPARGAHAPAVRIQGTAGEAHVMPPIFRPTRTRTVLRDGTVEERTFAQPGPGAGSGWFNGFGGDVNAEGEGHGMFWEADEAGTALLEGRKEGRFESLDESLVIMDVMDEIRRQGGVVYPEAVETTEYPVEL